MLPHARCCARKKLKRFLSPRNQQTAQPEPLLFLYPAWFQDATNQSQRTNLHSSRRNYSKDTENAVCSNLDAANAVGYQNASGTKLPLRRPNSAVAEGSRKSQAQARTNLSQSTLSEGRDSVASSIARISARSEDVEKSSVQVIKGRTANPPQHKSGTSDGLLIVRKFARKLARIPDELKSPAQEQMVVDTAFLDWLTGTTEPNMWLYYGDTKSQIFVLPAEKNDVEHRSIIVKGSKQSRDAAVSYLVEMREKFKSRRADQQTSTQSIAQSEASAAGRITSVVALPLPKILTIKSCYDYVKAIVNHQVPKSEEMSIYPGRGGFGLAATQMLLHLFSTPQFAPYLSVAALRLILEKFRGRTDLTSNLGRIWNAACDIGLVPDTKCYNLELERCLAVNNWGRVDYLLNGMQILHSKPDILTWSLLFKLLDSSHLRRQIVNSLLRSKNLTDVADRSVIVHALIQTEFRDVVMTEDGISKFTRWLQRAFGNEWASPAAISEMISLCIRANAHEKVHEVLDIAWCLGVSLDRIDSLILLDIVRRSRHFGDTMATFRTFFSQDGSKTAQAQIEMLFKLAWFHKLFNTCRLIWRYSATHGIITYAMKRLVTRSLAMNQTTKTQQNLERRNTRSLLAATVIGTDTSVPDHQTTFPLLSKAGWNNRPSQLLCRWLPNDGTRHEQLQLAHLLLSRDLSATKIFAPMRDESLLKGLQTAYRHDRQWYKEGFLDTASISDVFERAIKVGLRVKPSENNSQAEQSRLSTDSAVSQISSHSSLTTNADAQSRNDNTQTGTVPFDQETDIVRSSKLEPSASMTISPHSPTAAIAIPSLLFSGGNVLDTILEYLKYGWEIDHNQ